MAYEIHTLIDADGAPTDAQTKYSWWRGHFDFVLSNRETSYTINEPRPDGTLQGYHEFRVFLSLKEDLQEVINALESEFSDASWMVIHSRRIDDELQQDPWKSDKQYYNRAVENGLRSPVDLGFTSHTLNHEEINYLINGSEQSIPTGEYQFDVPDNKDSTTLYADKDGKLNQTNGVKIADIEVHPGRIVNIDPAEQPYKSSDWSTEFTRGSPPKHFADKGVNFPDPLPSDYLDINEIDESDIQQIYTLIKNHSDPETSELAKNIVDVIFGNK